MEHTEYKGIDLMKFIASILIVALHMIPLYEYNHLAAVILRQGFTRIAVPLFFMSSGYFFAVKLEKNKDTNSKEVLLKTLSRLAGLYFWGSAIYFVFDISELTKETNNILWAIGKYIGNFVFIGSHSTLGYMPALMFGLVMSYFAFQRKMIKPFLDIAFILYCIGLLSQSYYWLIKGIGPLDQLHSAYTALFQTTRNGLFFGFLFVMMGLFIQQNKTTYSSKHYLKGALLCLTISIAEVYTIAKATNRNSYDIYIMLIPLGYFVFQYFRTLNLNISSSLSKSFRSYSMGIYFIHGLFGIALDTLWARIGIHGVNTINFFLITIASIVSIYLLKRLNVGFINKLLS